jgi:hypothetical protein
VLLEILEDLEHLEHLVDPVNLEILWLPEYLVTLHFLVVPVPLATL